MNNCWKGYGPCLQGRVGYQSRLLSARAFPSPAVYHHRFGNLGKAYELIGYNAPEQFTLPRDLKRRTSAVRDGILRRLERLYPGYVSVVGRSTRYKPYLQLPGFTVTLQIARAAKTRSFGILKWVIVPGKSKREGTSMCLLIRLTRANDAVRDMYVLPTFGKTSKFAIREEDGRLKSAIKLENLEQFLEAAVRMHSRKEAMTGSAPGRFF